MVKMRLQYASRHNHLHLQDMSIACIFTGGDWLIRTCRGNLVCSAACLLMWVYFTEAGWAIHFETLSLSLDRVIKVCKLKKAIFPGTAVYGNDETELKCTVISKAYPS